MNAWIERIEVAILCRRRYKPYIVFDKWCEQWIMDRISFYFSNQTLIFVVFELKRYNQILRQFFSCELFCVDFYFQCLLHKLREYFTIQRMVRLILMWFHIHSYFFLLIKMSTKIRMPLDIEFSLLSLWLPLNAFELSFSCINKMFVS